MRDRQPCPVRSETVQSIRVEHKSRVFTLVFPALPEGAIPLDVEPLFEDHDQSGPTGYRLNYEVPDPGGPLRCGSEGCPNCDRKVVVH